MTEQDTSQPKELDKNDETRRQIMGLVIDAYGPTSRPGASVEARRILTEELGLDIGVIDALSPNQRPLLNEIIETLIKQSKAKEGSHDTY